MCEFFRNFEASGAHSLRPQQSRAIGRTDEGAGHDPGEAHGLGLGRKLDELFGMHPTVDWMVQGRGAQILRESQQIAAGLVQGAHGFKNFLAGFAHAQNQVRFRDHSTVVCAFNHCE